jgi:hypothetical protein
MRHSGDDGTTQANKRKRAFLGQGLANARGQSDVASDWAGFCATINGRRRDGTAARANSLTKRAAACAFIEPVKEHGMEDYRLEERDRPAHHLAAVERLSGRTKRRRIDFSGRGGA